MVRTEISLFLKNVPGELGRLSELLGAAGVNIDALTIQDASSYVQQLFQGPGKIPATDRLGRELQLHAQGFGRVRPDPYSRQ